MMINQANPPVDIDSIPKIILGLKPKIFVNFMGFTNQQLEIGSVLVKSNLLKHHPDTAYMINKAYLLILIKTNRFYPI